MSPRAHLRPATVLVFFIATAAVAEPARGQLGRWRPEERTLIADFSAVSALARGTTDLYIATRGGLVVYNDVRGVFGRPVTVVDGYPPDGVTAMAYDERSGMLWLAGLRQLLRFDPFSSRFVQSLRLSAPVSSIVPTGFSDSDLFIRTERGWLRISTFSGRTSRASQSEVAEAIDGNSNLRRRQELLQDTGFGVLAGFLGETPDGRRFSVTDVMPAWGGALFWVATAGNFVVEYDSNMHRWQPLTYGLLGRGVGAMAITPDGLWFGPLTAERGRFGVSLADPELQRWEVWDAFSARTAPGQGIRAMLFDQGVLWAGDVRGLFAFESESRRWRQVAIGGAGVSAEVLSLAPAAGGGVWVGTRRGAVRVASDAAAEAHRILIQERVLAVAEAAGWLWLGTARGLYRYELATGLLMSPREENVMLTQPVAALATRGDSVFAGLGAEVWVFPPGEDGRRFDLIPPGSRPVTALATGPNELWVGSEEGVLRWSSADNELNRLSFAAGDLPSERGVRDVVFHILPVGPREVWLSLPRGALLISALF